MGRTITLTLLTPPALPPPPQDPHPASTTGKSQGGGMMSQASSCASLAVSVDGSHYTSAMDVSTPDLTRSASDMTLDSAGGKKAAHTAGQSFLTTSGMSLVALLVSSAG